VEQPGGASEAKNPSGQGGQNHCKGASPSRSLIQRCPIFLDPGFRGRLDMRLDHGSQPALSGFLKGNKAERLLHRGNGRKHFRRAQHWTGMSQEEQLDSGAAGQRVRNAEQAAGERNGIQYGSGPASIGQSQHGRCDISKLYPRAAPGRVRLRNIVHGLRPSMIRARTYIEDYKRSSTSTHRPSRAPGGSEKSENCARNRSALQPASLSSSGIR